MKLIKYGAEWCQPCKAMDRYIAAVAAEANFDYEGIDIDAPGAVIPEGLSSVPLLVVLDGSGQEVARNMGALGRNQLKRWLENL